MDPPEYPAKEIPASEESLKEPLPFNNLPAKIRFGRELFYGFLSLKKWAAKSGTEVSGVTFINPDNKVIFRDLNAGDPSGVSIGTWDFTDLSHEKIEEFLKYILWSAKKDKNFILLPKDFDDYSLLDRYLSNTKHIIEKGLDLLGSLHTHPSDNPPGVVDFASLLFFEEEKMAGVVGTKNFYLMVKSKDTKTREIESLGNGESTHSRFIEETAAEVDRLTAQGLALEDATMKVLIRCCHENRIGLYCGELEENLFQRVV